MPPKAKRKKPNCDCQVRYDLDLETVKYLKKNNDELRKKLEKWRERYVEETKKDVYQFNKLTLLIGFWKKKYENMKEWAEYNDTVEKEMEMFSKAKKYLAVLMPGSSDYCNTTEEEFEEVMLSLARCKTKEGKKELLASVGLGPKEKNNESVFLKNKTLAMDMELSPGFDVKEEQLDSFDGYNMEDHEDIETTHDLSVDLEMGAIEEEPFSGLKFRDPSETLDSEEFKPQALPSIAFQSPQIKQEPFTTTALEVGAGLDCSEVREEPGSFYDPEAMSPPIKQEPPGVTDFGVNVGLDWSEVREEPEPSHDPEAMKTEPVESTDSTINCIPLNIKQEPWSSIIYQPPSINQEPFVAAEEVDTEINKSANDVGVDFGLQLNDIKEPNQLEPAQFTDSSIRFNSMEIEHEPLTEFQSLEIKSEPLISGYFNNEDVKTEPLSSVALQTSPITQETFSTPEEICTESFEPNSDFGVYGGLDLDDIEEETAPILEPEQAKIEPVTPIDSLTGFNQIKQEPLTDFQFMDINPEPLLSNNKEPLGSDEFEESIGILAKPSSVTGYESEEIEEMPVLEPFESFSLTNFGMRTIKEEPTEVETREVEKEVLDFQPTSMNKNVFAFKSIANFFMSSELEMKTEPLASNSIELKEIEEEEDDEPMPILELEEQFSHASLEMGTVEEQEPINQREIKEEPLPSLKFVEPNETSLVFPGCEEATEMNKNSKVVKQEALPVNGFKVVDMKKESMLPPNSFKGIVSESSNFVSMNSMEQQLFSTDFKIKAIKTADYSLDRVETEKIKEAVDSPSVIRDSTETQPIGCFDSNVYSASTGLKLEEISSEASPSSLSNPVSLTTSEPSSNPEHTGGF